MTQFEESILIEERLERVWPLLFNIGAIADWNPGVQSSHQSSEGPVAIGSQRYCQLNKRDFVEESVVELVPEQRITFDIFHTNLPFKEARIQFSLKESRDGTEVVVSPTYQLKLGILGKLLDKIWVRNQYRAGMRNLLKGLKAFAEKYQS